jgi:radical SAM superfamily enzyme YgiQ (UPF0313 family)
MLIATAVLEQQKHNVEFIDGAALNLTKNDIAKELKRIKPQIVVVHTTTPSVYNDVSYADLAKGLCGSTTVLIGPHVSAVPDNTFSIAKGSVDIIARKEYDFTLRDIAEGKPLNQIDGISYTNGGEIHHNKNRSDLDVNELPFPAWHHIKPQWYRDAGKRFPFLTLISGRGCFGKCTFCRDTSEMYGRKLRFRDPQLVVDEMEYDYKLFGYLKEIMFETDSFSAQASHVNGVCEELLKRNSRMTWSCNTRVDLDISLLPLMKRAGCRMLMVGFEFGTQEALDAVKKGITLEQSQVFAEKARSLGFIIHGCFMIGAPGETRQSAQKTIDFARSLPLDTVQFSGICVYPGTELYEWAKQNDYLVPKDWTEWINEKHEQTTLLNYPQLSKDEIDDFIDQGLRKFYLRPKQVMRMALNIKEYSDLKRKFFGLRSFLDYFSDKK